MALRDVTLDDKYDLTQRHVFVTGYQALVRLCLMQKELDRRNGLNTGGFVTGYRGSPLGTLDSQFLRARRFLEKSDIRFQGGLNEDLAATAVWGSQQAELRGEGKYDGVFAMWYGKGPGVDRTGDVFRHANLAGSAKYGGVLALMGDDHTAESSTTAHQSEYHFIDVMIPVLNPAGVQEVLDYGLYGWAMSRYTGAWTALKTMHETIESTAAIDASLERINIVIPDDLRLPEGGLNIRLHDQILAQEARLHDYKRDAMLAFVRANKLNRTITSGGRNPKIGIMTSTKWNSDWCAVVEDSAVWSSPIRASTPPCFEVPARLAWRNTSPVRSTPGPLPYHMPNTPSYLPSPRSSACCEPHKAVAARSSLSPAWNWMSAADRKRPALMICWSRPPSGAPR